MLQFSAAFRCLEKHHRLAPFGYIGRCAAAEYFIGNSIKSQPERQLYNSFSYRLNQGRPYSFEINVESAEGSFSPAEKKFGFGISVRAQACIVVRNSKVTRRKNQCRSSEIQPEVIAASFCSRIFRQKYCGNPTFTRPAQSTVSPVPSNKPESFLSF